MAWTEWTLEKRQKREKAALALASELLAIKNLVEDCESKDEAVKKIDVLVKFCVDRSFDGGEMPPLRKMVDMIIKNRFD